MIFGNKYSSYARFPVHFYFRDYHLSEFIIHFEKKGSSTSNESVLMKILTVYALLIINSLIR